MITQKENPASGWTGYDEGTKKGGDVLTPSKALVSPNITGVGTLYS